MIDPAGGSWYVERLTDDLARAAWAFFQEIEAAGGVGRGARRRARRRARRGRARARASRPPPPAATPITGVSEFPDLDEKPLAARRRCPSAAEPGGLPALPPGRGRTRSCATASDAAARRDRHPRRRAFLATLGPLATLTPRGPASPATCSRPAASRPSTAGPDRRRRRTCVGRVRRGRHPGRRALLDRRALRRAGRGDVGRHCGRRAPPPCCSPDAPADARGSTGIVAAGVRRPRRPRHRRAAPRGAAGRELTIPDFTSVELTRRRRPRPPGGRAPAGRPRRRPGTPPRASTSRRSTPPPTSRDVDFLAHLPGHRAVPARALPDDVRDPAVDDPPVRRVLHRRGVQRLLPPQPRRRARRACRSRSTWPPTAATTPTTRGSPATSAWPASPSTRSTTCASSSTASRWTRCRCR